MMPDRAQPCRPISPTSFHSVCGWRSDTQQPRVGARRATVAQADAAVPTARGPRGAKAQSTPRSRSPAAPMTNAPEAARAAARMRMPCGSERMRTVPPRSESRDDHADAVVQTIRTYPAVTPPASVAPTSLESSASAPSPRIHEAIAPSSAAETARERRRYAAGRTRHSNARIARRRSSSMTSTSTRAPPVRAGRRGARGPVRSDRVVTVDQVRAPARWKRVAARTAHATHAAPRTAALGQGTAGRASGVVPASSASTGPGSQEAAHHQQDATSAPTTAIGRSTARVGDARRMRSRRTVAWRTPTERPPPAASGMSAQWAGVRASGRRRDAVAQVLRAPQHAAPSRAARGTRSRPIR
ncbi:hypothetical protein B5P24_12180 [Clavibacter tessellarius]|uniref:Uncharacterized protein n=1 Tax=Clavibacter tessellarius TaxID=31965 RepID=A0A225CIY6_9MICO|nr:hypothetical protein B5P24_12180 [Clavibacter michiganensis subsp. tessellarius]